MQSQGEFAYSRGRVTSVKETELNVVVKRNNLEVRITLPHTSVRKLSQVRFWNYGWFGWLVVDADTYTSSTKT